MIIMLAALVIMLPAAAKYAGAQEKSFADHIISYTEAETRVKGKTETKVSPETEIRINGVAAIHDDSANIFYTSIKNAEDIPNAAISVNEGDLLIVDQEKNDTSLSYYAVIISDKTYMLTELVFTTLPIICLDIDTKIRDEYIHSSFRIYDNLTSDTTVLIKSAGQIKLRGNSSLNYPKKGYRFELLTEDGDSNKIKLLDLRKDDDWLLYAAYNDPEKVRNVFSSNLWYATCAENNPYGVTAGMEYRFAEMFINNHYEGLYALGYPVDDKQFKNGTEACIGLFKKTGQNVSESNVKLSDEPLSGYEIKTDDADEKYLWRTLREIFYTAGNSKDQSDVWNVINIDSAIDIFLFFNLTQAYDNTYGYSIRNIYFALMGDGQLLYIPWDLDQTWGLSWAGKWVKNYTVTYYLNPSFNRIMMMSPVYRFLNTEMVREKIRSRYAYLRANGWSDESIGQMINGLETQIFGSGAYERDKARWPGGTYIDRKNSADLSAFREYVMERLKYMDKYISGL